MGEHIHQIGRHLFDLAVTQIVGPDGMLHYGPAHILARSPGRLRRLQASGRDEAHALHRGGPGMGNGVGRLLQIGALLYNGHIPAFIGCQGHAHGSGRIGACTLCHHIRNGLGHLPMGGTLHKGYRRGVDPPIQYANLAVFIPGHVFILQHERQALIRSFHIFLRACQLYSLSMERRTSCLVRS